MSSCVLSSLQALGSSARSRGAAGIAELWNKIKLHCKTFHTLTWEIRVGKTPPKLRATGAETRHLVPCGYELAMDFHKHQQSAHSLTLRGLFEEPLGSYMTLSVERSAVLRAPGAPASFATSTRIVQGCLQRQLVGGEAEDAQWGRR